MSSLFLSGLSQVRTVGSSVTCIRTSLQHGLSEILPKGSQVKDSGHRISKEPAGKKWKKRRKFPAGICFHVPVIFRCIPLGTVPYFLTWDASPSLQSPLKYIFDQTMRSTSSRSPMQHNFMST